MSTRAGVRSLADPREPSDIVSFAQARPFGTHGAGSMVLPGARRLQRCENLRSNQVHWLHPASLRRCECHTGVPRPRPRLPTGVRLHDRIVVLHVAAGAETETPPSRGGCAGASGSWWPPPSGCGGAGSVRDAPPASRSTAESKSASSDPPSRGMTMLIRHVTHSR